MPKIDLDALEAMRSALDALTVGSGEWIEAWERYADTCAYAAPALIAAARERDALKARIIALEDSLDWFASETGDGAQREAAKLLGQEMNASSVERDALKVQLEYAERCKRELGDYVHAEQIRHIIESDTLRAALKQAVEALEEIAHSHDGNPPLSLADIPEIDYARRTISNMNRRARSTLATLKSAIGDQHE